MSTKAIWSRMPLNQQGLRKNYATLQAGSLSKPVEKTQPSVSSPTGTHTVGSDQTGFHKRVILTVCNQAECPIQNCSVNDSLSTEQQKIITTEDIGVLTHKVPSSLPGYQISNIDYNGKPKPQYFLHEKAVLPQGNRAFVPDAKATELVQEENAFKQIISNLSPDSVYSLKLKSYKESLNNPTQPKNPNTTSNDSNSSNDD